MELRRQRSSITVHGPGVPVKGLELVSPDTRTAKGRSSVLPASSCTLASDSLSCSGGRRMRSFKELDNPASSIKFKPQTAAIQSGVVAAAAGHTPTAVGCVDAGVDCAGVCASKFTGAPVGPAANDRNLTFMPSGPSAKSCSRLAFIYGRPANYRSSTSVPSLLRFLASEEGKRESASSLQPCGLVHLVDSTSSMPARPSPCYLTCRWGRRMRTLLLLSAAAAVLHILGLCSMTEVTCATSKNDETQPLLPRRPRTPRGLSVLKRKIAEALTKGVVAAAAGASGSASSGKSGGDRSSESEEDGEGIEPLEEQEEGSGISSALLELSGPFENMGPAASGGSGQGGHDRPARGSVRRRGSFGSAQGASAAAEAPGTSGVVTRARTRGAGGPFGKVMHFATEALHKLSPSSYYGEETLPLLEGKRKGGIFKQHGAPKHRVQRRVQWTPRLSTIVEEGLHDVGGAAGGAPSSTPFPQRGEQRVEGAAEALAGRRQARGRLPNASGEESGELAAREVALAPPVPAHPEHKPSLPEMRSRGGQGARPTGRVVAAGPPVAAGSGPRYAFPQMQAARRAYMLGAGSGAGWSVRRELRKRLLQSIYAGVPGERVPKEASRKEK